MEFRMSVVIAEHGFSDDAAEACLDALLMLYPDAGPVVSQNTATGHLTITVGLDATDPWAASNLGAEILTNSLTRAALRSTTVLDVSVTAVDHEDSAEHVGRLVPA